MKRKLIISILMLTLFAYLAYALGSVTLTIPADDVHTADDNVLTFVCNGTEHATYNITSVDLYTDTGGTWSIASTDEINAGNNSAKGLSYEHTSLTYGEELVWNCRVNYTHYTATEGDDNFSTWAVANKTVRVPYIGTTTLTSPVDNYYHLNDSITLEYSGAAAAGYNITSMTLWTDATGTWTATNITVMGRPENNTARNNLTVISGIADGTKFVWNVLTNYTKVDNNVAGQISLTYATANKTIFVEYPPVVTLNYPANGGYVSGEDTFNFTSKDAYGSDGDNYTDCIVYTNLSTWTTYGLTIQARNNTMESTTLALNENTYTWNVKCWEPDNALIYGFDSSNSTFTVDTTPPTVSVDFLNDVVFANETWFTAKTIAINFTVTDTNPKDCDFWTEINGAALVLNGTVRSLTNNVATNITLDFSDGNATFYLACNDSAGNWVNSSEYELRVDIYAPANPTIANNSRENFCDQWNVTITAADDVNVTLDYGTAATKGTFLYNTSFLQTQEIHIPLPLEYTDYWLNVTVCDEAGNCNETNDDTFLSPFKVCSGWTYLGIYESVINMSEIARLSGADYVYSWYQNNQSWFYYLGSGAGGNQLLSYGDEVMLWESTNDTWEQNRSGVSVGDGYYDYTIYIGDNYIPLTVNYTFGSLSSTLMNDSDSWGAATTELNGSAINFTWYDAYNNSILDWHGGFTYDVAYNWTWNNNSNLGMATGIEVGWLYSEYNTSDFGTGGSVWNGTALTWNNGSTWR